MTPVLVLAVGLLAGVGVYLVLARKLFSTILGLSLLTHAANLLMLSTGDPGQRAPIVVDGVSAVSVEEVVIGLGQVEGRADRARDAPLTSVR